MPEAVTYHYQGKPYTIYFSQPRAVLPLRMADGSTKLVKWGRRQVEESEMPFGGWARLESIYQGKWSVYQPKPVLLAIDKFMKLDYEGNVHWYDVIQGQWIQGLLAHEQNEYRVYIVTIVPQRLDIFHDRWPRIIVR